MPGWLAQPLALPGLEWLLLGAALAGLVRGFSGFGAALVFLPLAALVVTPVKALLILTIMDIFGPLPNLRRAWRDGVPADVARMVLALVLGLPLGLALLFALPAEAFRYAVSAGALILPLVILSGWRYRGPLSARLLYLTGGLAGLSGGAVGLPGPPVILLYMSSMARAAVVRANTMLFLYAFDLGLLAVLALAGRVTPDSVLVALLIAPVAILGNIAGAAMFRENREGLYRAAGLGIVALAGLRGLPLWD